jgi:hypothetical protein
MLDAKCVKCGEGFVPTEDDRIPDHEVLAFFYLVDRDRHRELANQIEGERDEYYWHYHGPSTEGEGKEEGFSRWPGELMGEWGVGKRGLTSEQFVARTLLRWKTGAKLGEAGRRVAARDGDLVRFVLSELVREVEEGGGVPR